MGEHIPGCKLKFFTRCGVGNCYTTRRKLLTRHGVKRHHSKSLVKYERHQIAEHHYSSTINARSYNTGITAKTMAVTFGILRPSHQARLPRLFSVTPHLLLLEIFPPQDTRRGSSHPRRISLRSDTRALHSRQA